VAADNELSRARLERLRRWLDVSISHSPSVLYDGSAVLFVSDPTGLPLPYRVPVTGGTPTLLAGSGERADRVRASPKGPRAVLSRDTGGNEHWQLSLVDLSGDGAAGPPRELTADPAVIHSAGAWRPDGRRFLYSSNARDARYFDVYELDVDAARPPRRIWQDDGYADLVDARGESLLIARANTNLDVDLFEIREAGPVHLNPHEGEV